MTLDRLSRRRSLVEQFDRARADLATTARGQQLDRYRQMTYELLQSPALRDALDVRREPPSLRKLYGQTLFGQSCLAARRLVEAGSRVVTRVLGRVRPGRQRLGHALEPLSAHEAGAVPGLDQAWYGLITDLDQRGLLDETLVVCTSEHGRTPKITTDDGGGRDHWSRVYSSLVAGGGTKRGHVVGASDKHGGDVADRPISPKDLLATMYHLLGIDHHQTIHDAWAARCPWSKAT